MDNNGDFSKANLWKRGPWRKLLFFVGLPVFLSVIYYSLIASDIYVSVSKFSVKKTGQEQQASFGQMLSSAVGTTQSGNTKLVREYIRSRSLLTTLQDSVQLRQHYTQESIDFLSRLSSDAPMDDFITYYRDMIRVKEDETSGVTTLEVRAFDPEQAQRIGSEILDRAEVFVNMLSERMQEDALSLAKQDVAEAKQNVFSATQALRRFRNQHNNIDPVETGGGILTLIQELKSKLATKRVELKQARDYLQEDSAKVQKLKQTIEAIRSQIEEYKNSLAGENEQSIANIMQEYEQLQIEKRLAEEQYKVALSSLESARKEASKKSTYVLRMVEPSQPDEATEPNRLLKIATVLAITLVAYAVGGLLIAAIREHQM